MPFPPFSCMCVHVFACVHVQTCACMWRLKVNVENHPQLLLNFIHQSRLCSQTQSTLARLVSPARSLWGIPSLLHPEARVTSQLPPTPGIYVGSGTQAAFSLLGSKHFNY